MASTASGVSRGKYLTTRTRHEFVVDIRSCLSSTLLPIEVVGSMLSGGEKGDRRPVEPTADMTEEQVAALRARRASRPYHWFRKKGRRYTVYNLDTQDDAEYARASHMLGLALPTRQAGSNEDLPQSKG